MKITLQFPTFQRTTLNIWDVAFTINENHTYLQMNDFLLPIPCQLQPFLGSLQFLETWRGCHKREPPTITSGLMELKLLYISLFLFTLLLSLSLALPHLLLAYCFSSAELKDIHLCPTMFPALLTYTLLHPLAPVVKIPSPS